MTHGWPEGLYEFAKSGISPDNSGPMRHGNESRHSNYVVNQIVEIVTYDNLHPRLRRMFAFANERMSCVQGLLACMERVEPVSHYHMTLFAESTYQVMDRGMTPTVHEYLNHLQTDLVQRSPKWPKHGELLSDLEPWKRKWPARFGIRRARR